MLHDLAEPDDAWMEYEKLLSELSRFVGDCVRYLEDAAGGVPLFPRGLLVVLEDLVDDGQERIELGPGAWDRTAIARRFGVLEDLLESVPVDAVRAAGSAFAQAVNENATADLGPDLHVGVHP